MDFSSAIFGKAFDGAHQSHDPSPAIEPSASNSDSHDGLTQPTSFGFLDVLDILRQYQVPSIDLNTAVGTTQYHTQDASAATSTLEQQNHRVSTNYNHTLGGGYSAIVIKHATEGNIYAVTTDSDVLSQKTPDLVARVGTLVAFKKIAPRPADNGISNMSRQSEAFRTICQEITVCGVGEGREGGCGGGEGVAWIG